MPDDIWSMWRDPYMTCPHCYYADKSLSLRAKRNPSLRRVASTCVKCHEYFTFYNPHYKKPKLKKSDSKRQYGKRHATSSSN